jgi:hypothetical protein
MRGVSVPKHPSQSYFKATSTLQTTIMEHLHAPNTVEIFRKLSKFGIF